MTGHELQKQFTQRFRDFLASEACRFELSYVEHLSDVKEGRDHEFTVSDSSGDHDYTISIKFEDPR